MCGLEIFDNSITEQIELRMIRPSKFPIRYDDSKTSAEFVSLKASIKEHGLLQPIVVRPLEYGFEIVAGHRRFSACRSLRWRFITCKIREFTDRQAYEVQLTENIQRKSMDVLEEAEAYQKYVVDHGWGGVSDLAQRIGKSAEHVSHRMNLLKLPKGIQEKIASGNLGVSQALEITTTDSSLQKEIAGEIIDNNMTVQQIRSMKRKMSQKSEPEGFQKERRSKQLNIVRKATLALQVALSRIDDLVDDAHKVAPSERAELLTHLMNMRREIHSMIDENIHYKKTHTK